MILGKGESVGVDQIHSMGGGVLFVVIFVMG